MIKKIITPDRFSKPVRCEIKNIKANAKNRTIGIR